MKNGTITTIYAEHYARQNLTRNPAKMTLWAKTETGDDVWLGKFDCDTRRNQTKLSELERKYEFLVGKEIKYALKKSRSGSERIGFVRPDLIEYEVKYSQEKSYSEKMKGGEEK